MQNLPLALDPILSMPRWATGSPGPGVVLVGPRMVPLGPGLGNLHLSRLEVVQHLNRHLSIAFPHYWFGPALGPLGPPQLNHFP